jgi:hypothetical protein
MHNCALSEVVWSECSDPHDHDEAPPKRPQLGRGELAVPTDREQRAPAAPTEPAVSVSELTRAVARIDLVVAPALEREKISLATLGPRLGIGLDVLTEFLRCFFFAPRELLVGLGLPIVTHVSTAISLGSRAIASIPSSRARRATFDRPKRQRNDATRLSRRCM